MKSEIHPYISELMRRLHQDGNVKVLSAQDEEPVRIQIDMDDDGHGFIVLDGDVLQARSEASRRYGNPSEAFGGGISDKEAAWYLLLVNIEEEILTSADRTARIISQP